MTTMSPSANAEPKSIEVSSVVVSASWTEPGAGSAAGSMMPETQGADFMRASVHHDIDSSFMIRHVFKEKLANRLPY